MQKYYYALGRRKDASASVRLFEGNEQSTVNGKPAESIYNQPSEKKRMLEPLVAVDGVKKYYFTAKTNGGGRKGQLDAIVLGIARALIKLDSDYKPILKRLDLLTRDDRQIERKKTGLRKARKAPQYSKR